MKKNVPVPSEAVAAPPQSVDGQDFNLNTLLKSLSALKKGDFTVRLPVEWMGVGGKVADAFNSVVELNERMAVELERVSVVVGKKGRINQRASLGDVSGSWDRSVGFLNSLIG